MKAAVIYQKGDMPQYSDFPEPMTKNENEILVSVKAVAIKHFDRSKADWETLFGRCAKSRRTCNRQ